MSLTYGFYNSKDHDRMYDAVQLSMLFDGLINDGVYATIGKKVGSNERVTPFYMTSLGSGNRITIGPGRAWFRHTWSYNDADVVIKLPDPPYGTNKKRYDAIVLDINAGQDVRANSFAVVSGTEKTTSSNANIPYPTLENTETRLQVPLAYVLRKNSDSAISDADITSCIGDATLGCPYVTGVISYISIEQLLRQAATDWNNFKGTANQWYTEFTTGFEADANEWYTNFTSGLEEYATNFETNYVNDFTNWSTVQKNEFISWMTGEKNDFDTWFANIQYILDGDVAGHLQNEIDDLYDRIVPIEKGGTGNDHGHIQSGQIDTSSEKGEYSTSEGMHTISSGKCAHAEGGGNYQSQFADAHFSANNLITSSMSPYILTDTGEPYKNKQIGQIHIGSYTSLQQDKPVKSVYVAFLLKNDTTGDILKKQIACIGANSINSSYYIGTRLQDSDVEITDGYVDYGNMEIDYPLGVSSKCWYMSDFKVEYPEENAFYIDLPWTGSTVEVDVYGETSNFSLKSFWIVDMSTGFVIYADNDNNLSTSDLNNKGMDGLTVTNVWIGTNGGHIRYYSKNPGHKTYRIYFSSSIINTPNDIYDDNALLVFGVPKIYIKRSGNQTFSYDIWLYYDGSPIVMSVDGNHSDTYSLSIYYTYTNENTEDPIVWIPAGYILSPVGKGTRAIGNYSHAEGHGTKAVGNYSHAEGYGFGDKADDTKNPGAYGNAAHSEGYMTFARGTGTHSEGNQSSADGDYSHAEGVNNIAYSLGGHVEGGSNTVGSASEIEYDIHAEGYSNLAHGHYSHVEGQENEVYKRAAHAEGYGTKAKGIASHSEGYNTTVESDYSHAEGYDTIAGSASNTAAHAEGYLTEATGTASHAEGKGSKAYGLYSHAGGGGVADLANQFVHGCFGFVGQPIVHESASGESTMVLEHANIFNGINLIYPPSSGTYILNIVMMTNDTEYKQCHAWLAILKEYGSTSYNDIGVYLIHVPDINSAGSPKIEQIYKSGDIVHTLSGNTGYKLVFNKASSAGAALQIYRIM